MWVYVCRTFWIAPISQETVAAAVNKSKRENLEGIENIFFLLEIHNCFICTSFFTSSSGVQFLPKPPKHHFHHDWWEDALTERTKCLGTECFQSSSPVQCVTFLLCGMCLTVDSSHRSVSARVFALCCDWLSFCPLSFSSHPPLFLSQITHLFSCCFEIKQRVKTERMRIRLAESLPVQVTVRRG